jgi:hypothetical protein
MAPESWKCEDSLAKGLFFQGVGRIRETKKGWYGILGVARTGSHCHWSLKGSQTAGEVW